MNRFMEVSLSEDGRQSAVPIAVLKMGTYQAARVLCWPSQQGDAVTAELVATPGCHLKHRSFGKDNLPILVCTSELVKHAGG